MGISTLLPSTGYIKMIDIWMIFTMAYPFFIISLHCLQEVVLTVYIHSPFTLFILVEQRFQEALC